MGERAARGADHRIEPDAERPGLRRHLLGGQDVAEPAERRMPGGGMDHVRPAAPAGERSGEALQRRIGRRLVLAHGERMQRRAEQPVEQQVARSTVEGTGVVHALFELDVRVHPEAARPGRGDADEVRLHRPGDQQGVGPRACAPPKWNSSWRTLFPPKASPVQSSRLIHSSTPSAAPRFGAGSSGVGAWPSRALGNRSTAVSGLDMTEAGSAGSVRRSG